MQLKWLEDLAALAQARSFTRAAELCHVTLPAFGRRIKAREAWAGRPIGVLYTAIYGLFVQAFIRPAGPDSICERGSGLCAGLIALDSYRIVPALA